MKKLLTFSTVALVLACALATPVHAWQGGRGGGYGGHGAYGGGYYGGHGGYRGYGSYGGWWWGGFALRAAVTGLAFQSAYWGSAPYYGVPSYAPYYAEAAYAAPAYIPQTYIEQQPIAPRVNVSNWYYCKESRAYYPYVRTCKAGWQALPTVPSDR